MRGVEALPPQQDAYRADILGGIGLAEDRALILGGETTTRTGNHFRIGKVLPGGQTRGAPAVLAASPLRSEAANAAEEVLVLFVLIKVRFLSPPYSNC